jgi:hypothetical protein
MDNTSVPKTDAQIINHAIETLTGNKARWVLWRLEDGGKKIPYTKYNRYADTTDPNDWITYDEAQAGLSSDGEYSGVGIIFDGTILGVDLDKCLNEAGRLIDPLLEAFVVVSDTYTEVSPSGTGLHLFFKLTAPLELIRNRHEGREAYTQNRYFTFTGNLYEQNTVRTITPDDAVQLLSIIGYPWQPAESPIAITSTSDSSQASMKHDAVKQKMFASKRGAEIESLYNGDTSRYGDDTSKADAALVKHLAYWTNNNRELMKGLWLSSPLGQRDKTRLREDYVERTLNLPLSNTTSGSEVSNDTTAVSPTKRGIATPADIFVEEELDLEDLLKLNVKVEWDVEQLITKGSLNMLASAPHQGKTFMALHIAVCVANGLPVFGRYKVTEAKNVLIVNEEDILADIKNRLESMVPDQRANKRIKLYCSTGLKISPEWVDGLLARAQQHNAGLIILDSLSALSLANENEAQAMQQVMDQLRRIINAGITVIFIHHNRKGQNGEASSTTSMEMARGSTAITAAVHGYLSIQALSNEQFKVSQLKLKANVAKAKPFIVQMHTELTPQATFRYQFEYLGEHNSNLTAVDNVQDKVMHYCRSKGALPFTRKTLVDARIANSTEDQTLRKTLKWMRSKGYITSQRLADLNEEQRQLLGDCMQPYNTLVYSPTLKFLEKADEILNQIQEERSKIEDIPF